MSVMCSFRRHLTSIQRVSRRFNSSTSTSANNIVNQAQLNSSPDKIMFIEENEKKTTYGAFMKRAGQYATTLSETYKVGKGDRVMARVSKSVDTCALYVACLQIGAVYIPVNPAYTESETAHYIKDATPTVLVTCNNELDSLFRDRVAVVVEEGSLGREVTKQKACIDVEHVTIKDAASICYTSGTTGLPKGAVLTHGGLSSNAHQLVKSWGFSDNDVNLHCLPFYHVHGMFISLHSSLFSHSSLIWRSKFDIEDCINFLPQATVMMGVPTFFSRLVNNPKLDKKLCQNMRVFISGSAPLSVATIDTWKEKTGFKICERYGMTEAQVITSNPMDGERKAGTVGKAIEGVQVRINEKNDKGEIEVFSSSLFGGYWKNPKKTAEDFTEDGWFKTGDVGSFDEDGYLTIGGRSKDMIITGGLNVYPKEIEDIVDKIDFVKESAIIAVPHSDFGEAVVAIVVLKKKEEFNVEEEIQKLMKNRVANYKVPKKVVVIDELPRNHITKIQKNVLRDRYKDLFVNV